MDILIIAEYMGDILEPDKSNSRFMYLYKMLEKDHNVEIVTSDFAHGTKSHIRQNMVDKLKVKATLLHESGYPKNVCFKRLISHRELARNLENYLSKRKKPDVVYCAVPSLDVAYVAAEYCRKNNIRNILDIQDLWPEAFKMVFHMPLISDLIFMPMENKANKIYRQADQIVAVSQTYADRAMRSNTKCKVPSVVYLGTEKKTFDKYAEAEKPYTDELKPTAEQSSNHRIVHQILTEQRHDITRIVYCGTLGSSYDLPVIFKALRLMNPEQLKKLLFVIMGDGPRKQEFENISVGLPVVFTGRLPYSEMVWILKRCDIAVNPIVKGAAQSIINKHMDYAMAGLPVISTQESVEYRDLLEKYKAGINCKCGSETEVAEAINLLLNDNVLRQSMGENSRFLAEEKFDREKIYTNLAKQVVHG